MFWLLLLSLLINVIFAVYAVMTFGVERLIDHTLFLLELQKEQKNTAKELLKINTELRDVLQEQAVSDGWKAIEQFLNNY